jgi:beta-lactamase class A
LNRRDILCSTLAILASPALAQEAPIAALKDYERDSGGRIGLWVENLRTRDTIAWRAHERFVMCSTFKASLAACVLANADRGRIRLDELLSYGPADLLEYAPVAKLNLKRGAMSVTDMCAAAVELSDNTCANILLARVGGSSVLTEFLELHRRSDKPTGPQRTAIESLPSRRSTRQHRPCRHGGKFAGHHIREGTVAGLPGASHTLDAGLQDGQQTAARRPTERLACR